MDETQEQAQARRVLKWDGTVTAGNLLTAFAMLLALTAWGFRLEGRVEDGKARIARLEIARERDDRDTSTLREVLARLDANQQAMLESLRRQERALEAATRLRPGG